MIIIRVELHSAITGKMFEIARMCISNVGGTQQKGDYACETFRGRDARTLDRRQRQRFGQVKNYPRLRIHVWHLVARALAAMNYIDTPAEPWQPDIIEHDIPIPEPAEGPDPAQTTSGGVLIPSMAVEQAGEPEAGEMMTASASAAASPALLAPAEPGGCEGGCGHAPEVFSTEMDR